MLDRDHQRSIAGRGGALTGLDSSAFLAELGRPSGGLVGLVRGIGPAGLAALRAAVGNDSGSTAAEEVAWREQR